MADLNTIKVNSTEVDSNNASPKAFVFSTIAFLVFLLLLLGGATYYASRHRGTGATEVTREVNRTKQAIPDAQMLDRLETSFPKKSFRAWQETMREKAQVSESANTQFVCSICLDHINDDDNIYSLACLHAFHDKCLAQWFLTCHLTCPLCQKQIYPPQADNDGGSAA